MQEIKVTMCLICPMLYPTGHDNEFGCMKGAFNMLCHTKLNKIHPDCPIKGETITFKIGENE